jgi:pyridoxal 5'-phosphate synthase pdxT subunit
MKIGILALQGGYQAHADCLAKLGISTIFVKKNHDFLAIDGLIIPGGESSTLLKLIHAFHLFPALEQFYQQKKPIFGTCAGMILLARSVIPQQTSLNWMDILVARNAYGRQLESFIATSDPINHDGFQQTSVELVFIRAPKVLEYGTKVHILVSHQSQPILLQQEQVLAASFHPELSQQNIIHQYFMRMVETTLSCTAGKEKFQ